MAASREMTREARGDAVPFLTADPLAIGGGLLAAARQWPDNDALVIDGRRATHAQLLDEVVARARGLVGAGVRPRDHVGILMTNCWDYVVLFYAITLIGGCAVPLNARYRRDDLGYTVRKADLRFLFTGGHAHDFVDYRDLLAKVYPELARWDGRQRLNLEAAPLLERIFNLADPRETVWPTEAELAADAERTALADIAEMARAVEPDDVGLMIFSSGTTADPKACMLTHRSLGFTGAALAERFGMDENDRFWDPLPMFHMSTMLPLAACRAAGSAFLGTAAFDAARALDVLEKEAVTIAYPVFPTITTAIISHPDFAGRDLSSIRVVIDVGPSDLLRRYMRAIPQAVHVSCYGLTEASGVPFYSELTDSEEERLSSCGRPFAGMEVRVVDPETGGDVACGEHGEIWLRGPCVFEGYYRDPVRTAEVFAPGGWLKTGDRGMLRASGHLCYTGRFKDMLKIGGENVAAQEIENFLATHPAIQIAQVVGVPDDHLQEVAAAFLELRPGAALEAEDLVAFCAGRIATYKIPRYVRVVDGWPMSSTKIQKFRLRDDFVPDGKLDVREIIRGRSA